jgi:hypothetical protein
LEHVIVCQSTFAEYIPNNDAYTWSEYEWLMVEMNTLWRRAMAEVGDIDKRTKIHFLSILQPGYGRQGPHWMA